MCVYEKLILIKRLHYIVYYLLVGTLALLIQELLLRAAGESSLPLFRTLLIYWSFTILPIVLIYFSHQFQLTLNKTKSFLIPPNINNYKSWVLQKNDDFFSFKSWPIRISVLILGSSILATILSFQKLYHSVFPNIIVYVLILLGALVGSHGVYFVFATLYFLSQFVKYPINVPFFTIQNEELKYIQGFYFRAALVVLFCYFYLIYMVWSTPFSFSGLILFWLSFAGFCPLVLFLWSYFQIHILMVRIKQSFINICSSKIQIVMKELDNNLSSDNVDKLLKLMETQSNVEKLSEWPININSSITFLVTLVLPLASFGFDIFKIK